MKVYKLLSLLSLFSLLCYCIMLLLICIVLRCIVLYPVEDEGGGGEGGRSIDHRGLVPQFYF